MKVSAGSYDSALQGRKEGETQKKNEDKRERERFGLSLMQKCATELDTHSWLAP